MSVPQFHRLNDYVDWYAQTAPQALAFSGRERLTYPQLRAQVRDCAAVLAGYGVGRGDRVVTLSTPGGAFLVTFLATAMLGAIWSGLNPRHTDVELDKAVSILEPKFVFARTAIEARDYTSWMSRLPADIGVVSLSSGDASALADFTRRKRVDDNTLSAMAELTDPAAPCLIVFTSGSTGVPRGAMISQRALIGTARVQCGQWPVSPLRVFNNLPINHIGCVGDLCCYALIGGGTSVFSERFDPSDTMTLCQREEVSVLGQVPTQFVLTLGSPAFRASAFDSTRLIFWGGAQASAELVAALHALGKPIATSYGQTETVGSITFTPPNATLEGLANTVGRCVAPYEIRTAGKDGGVLSPGEAGEIQVRSPFCMNGYWRNPEATKKAFTADGWLRTGDVGIVDSAGQLKLIGRTTETFKSGGYNIYPTEIEQAVASHPAVADNAVVPVADTVFGMVGAAMVQAKPGHSLSADILRTHLATRLANYKIPKRILIAKELPRLPVGKIDRQAVREIFMDDGARGDL